jgi:putative ABC transport system permease protein
MRLTHIVRRLLQLPAFTTIAVLTLAIGIGANAAIFSVIEGVLLKPLPFAHPDELVVLDQSAPGVGLKRTGASPFLYFTRSPGSAARCSTRRSSHRACACSRTM